MAPNLLLKFLGTFLPSVAFGWYKSEGSDDRFCSHDTHRQWFDQGGWYDRKELSFRQIIDLTFVGSMGPPGGGRQLITPRFIRHFNVIGYVEMSDASKVRRIID